MELPPVQTTMRAEVNHDVVVKTNALMTRCSTMESDFNAIQIQIQNINSDAEITDENIARLGCRLTNLEHILRKRGLAIPFLLD